MEQDNIKKTNATFLWLDLQSSITADLEIKEKNILVSFFVTLYEEYQMLETSFNYIL